MLPIKTIKNGESTTKIIVEDVYKTVNAVYEALDKCYNNSSNILDSVHRQYTNDEGETYEGELIVTAGISEPCHGDVYDEEIGNEIAFRKAKVKANLRKNRILKRIVNELCTCIKTTLNEAEKTYKYLNMDIKALRKYNPDYLKDFELDDE